MTSIETSSSSASVIDNVSDTDYMTVVDEVMELKDEVSETGMLLKILEAYKKVEHETVEFYLACHPFAKIIKETLRKLYTNCHQRWNHKNGTSEKLVMPYPIREGIVDAEEKKKYALEKLINYKLKNPSFKIDFDAVGTVTNMTRKEIEKQLTRQRDANYRANVKEVQHTTSSLKPDVGAFQLQWHKNKRNVTITFMPNLPKKLTKLCQKLVNDATFADYMEEAEKYIADIDGTRNDEAIEQCEVLLRFLVLVRKGEGFDMFTLVKSNEFALTNQEGMRKLYGKGFRKYVEDNNLARTRHDPAPWPINIMKKKPATEEENEIMEEELRKRLDNPCYRCDYEAVAKRTSQSALVIYRFVSRTARKEAHLSRKEQDRLREIRLEKLIRKAEKQTKYRRWFREKNLEFFEAEERKRGIIIERSGQRSRVTGPRKPVEQRGVRARTVKQLRIKSKEVVESSGSESEKELTDNDNNSDDNSDNEALIREKRESDSSESETEENAKDDHNEQESRSSSRKSTKCVTTKRQGKTSKPVVKKDEWDWEKEDSTSDDSSSEDDDSTDDDSSSRHGNEEKSTSAAELASNKCESVGKPDVEEPSTAAVEPAAKHRGRPKKQAAQKPAKLVVRDVGRRGRSSKQALVEPLGMVDLAPKRRGGSRKQAVKPVLAEVNDERFVSASGDVHIDLQDHQTYLKNTENAHVEEKHFEHAVPLLDGEMAPVEEAQGVSVEEEPIMDSAMAPLVEHVADNQFMGPEEAEQNVEQDGFVDDEQPIEQEEREQAVAQQNQFEQEGGMMNPEAPAQLPEITNNEKPKIVIPRAKTEEYRRWLKSFIEVGEPFDSLTSRHVEMPRPIKEEAGEGIQVIVQSEPNPMRREITALLDLITAEEEAAENVPGPSRKRRHNQADGRVEKRARTGEMEEREIKQEVGDDDYDQHETMQAEPPAPVNQIAPVVAPAEPLLVVPKEEVEDV